MADTELTLLPYDPVNLSPGEFASLTLNVDSGELDSGTRFGLHIGYDTDIMIPTGENSTTYAFRESIQSSTINNISTDSGPFIDEFDLELYFPTLMIKNELDGVNQLRFDGWTSKKVDGNESYAYISEEIGTINQIDQSMNKGLPSIVAYDQLSSKQLEFVFAEMDRLPNVALKSEEVESNETTLTFAYFIDDWSSTSNHRDWNANNWDYVSGQNSEEFELVVGETSEDTSNHEFNQSYENFLLSTPYLNWFETFSVARLGTDYYYGEYGKYKDVLMIGNDNYGYSQESGQFGKFLPGWVLIDPAPYSHGDVEPYEWSINFNLGSNNGKKYFVINEELIVFDADDGNFILVNTREQSATSSSFAEFGDNDSLAGAAIDNDGKLILLIHANNGVGGYHVFSKRFDLDGNFIDKVVHSTNSYDSQLLSVGDGNFAILDTGSNEMLYQKMSNQLDEFDLPVNTGVDAWAQTHARQLSDQILYIAKRNGSEWLDKDLFWLNNGGTESDDILLGDPSNNLVKGLNGNDILALGSGDDTSFGGAGQNYIDGGSGDDTFILERNDTFSASYVAHNLSSNIQIGTGVRINLLGKTRFEDVMDGSDDNDTIELTDLSDAFFLHDNFSGFHSHLELSSDYISRSGTARVESVETINGLGGDDIIDLTSPNYSLAGQVITINGGAGNDVIWGSDATETLIGGDGNDILFGGSGNDTLTGGSGADTFEFTRTAGSDTITDFESGTDTIKLYIDYTFDVSKTESTTSDYSIDGQSDPTLYLVRGKTYTFEMSGNGHPFYIKSTDSTSGTANEYTTGVTRIGSENSGNDGDKLQFLVPSSAPDTLWYQCSSHSGMLGQLNIVDTHSQTLQTNGNNLIWNALTVQSDTAIDLDDVSFFVAIA